MEYFFKKEQGKFEIRVWRVSKNRGSKNRVKILLQCLHKSKGAWGKRLLVRKILEN